jgi:altronate dehydratase large subunit
MKFKGYRREDGSVGIRNKVLILPTVACSAETAKIISSQVAGTVTIYNQLGCGQIGSDAQRTIDILIGTGKNPNIFGVVVVGLGCETAQASIVAEGVKKSGKSVEVVVIQEEGGTLKAINKGVQLAMRMAQEASRQERVECNISELVLAVECGGSDPTSGLASNPAVGAASDILIKNGGTTILSETTEFIGAEHVLASNAVNSKVGDEVLRIVRRLEDSVKARGEDLRGGNPSPGNIKGGITTIEEKSLGCTYKGGKSPVVQVVDYGVEPDEKGLILMDSPGMDVDSMIGMVAGGAQICVFTTGRGTPLGNSIVPVIKVTGNPKTYEKMKDNIEINAGEILNGNKTIDEMGEIIFREIIEVAKGKLTSAEIFGFSEFNIWRCGSSV